MVGECERTVISWGSKFSGSAGYPKAIDKIEVVVGSTLVSADWIASPKSLLRALEHSVGLSVTVFPHGMPMTW